MPSDDGEWLRCSAAARRLCVTGKTIGKWARAGLIRSLLLPGNGVRQHRLYDVESVVHGSCTGGGAAVLDNPPADDDTEAAAGIDAGSLRRDDAVYARVSTRKQEAALERQTAALCARHPGCRVFRDVASGLNFRRRGLRALLDAALAGRIRTLYIAHRDRLCRFAYDCLEYVLGRCGTRIVVDAPALDPAAAQPAEHDRERELADDLLAIVTVFGARVYGSRGGSGAGRLRGRKRSREETADDADESDRDRRGGVEGRPEPTESTRGGRGAARLPDADANDPRAEPRPAPVVRRQAVGLQRGAGRVPRGHPPGHPGNRQRTLPYAARLGEGDPSVPVQERNDGLRGRGGRERDEADGQPPTPLRGEVSE